MRHGLQDNRRAKRYLWSLVLTLFFWVATLLVVIFVDPESLGQSFLSFNHLIFLVPLGMALWFSGSLIAGNTKIGAVVAVGGVVSAYLRMIGIGNWWILAPWWGVIVSTVFLIFKNKADKVDKSEAS